MGDGYGWLPSSFNWLQNGFFIHIELREKTLRTVEALRVSW
jgi:hypothetical protein